MKKELLKYSTFELSQEIRRRNKESEEKTIKIIIDTVCSHYGSSYVKKGKNGVGKKQERKVMRALSYIFRFKRKMICEDVSDILERKRSTITVSSNKVKSQLEVDTVYKSEIDCILNKINILLESN